MTLKCSSLKNNGRMREWNQKPTPKVQNSRFFHFPRTRFPLSILAHTAGARCDHECQSGVPAGPCAHRTQADHGLWDHGFEDKQIHKPATSRDSGLTVYMTIRSTDTGPRDHVIMGSRDQESTDRGNAVPAAKEVSKSHWFLVVMAELIRLRPDQAPRNYLKHPGSYGKALIKQRSSYF
jgi:hypothetical protein